MTTSPSSPHRSAWALLRAANGFVTVEPAPVVRPRWRRRRPLWLSLAAVASTAALLGLTTLDTTGPRGPTAVQAATAPDRGPAAPAWVEVLHPFAAYDLAGGPYAKLPMRYAARRDGTGGAREDLLTYGTPQPGDAFLRLAFLRRGSEAVAPTSIFLDAARLAAGAGLAVTRSGLGARLETRFGPFEVAGVAVEGQGRGSDCMAFRLADPTAAPILGLTGLACGTLEHPIDAVTLGCTIDRLDLVSAGDDEALRGVFVAAERRRRNGCATAPRVDLRLGAASERPGTRPLKEPL